MARGRCHCKLSLKQYMAQLFWAILACPACTESAEDPENVLLVPGRNVLLTGSGWQGGTRSPANDPKGPRPAGRVEESTEEIDHPMPGGRRARCHRAARSADAGEAEEGWRPLDCPRASRPAIEPQAEPGVARTGHADSLARGLSRLRANAGQRVPGKETQAAHRPRSAAAADDPGRAVARAEAKDRSGSPMAAAQSLARPDGAMGYIRARLAGASRPQAVSDPYDRRRHQRVDGTVCGTRFHRREHASAGELSGTARTSAGVLHRQGRHVPHHAQGVPQIHRSFSRRTATGAAYPDWPGAARAGHRLDCRALTAGQRPDRAQFW